MPRNQSPKDLRPTTSERVLHLFLLSGFAVAQPLFDLLSSEPGFFVAKRSQTPDIVALAVILMMTPPLILGAIEAIAGLFSDRARRNVHDLFVGLLIALTALPPLNRIGDFPAVVSLGCSVLVGISGAFLYRRSPRVRSLGTVAAPAAVVFAVVFFLHPSIWKILYPRQIALESATDPTLATPVVLVIFDGLPLVTLLDESRQIDSARFPNFADLASTSTWFRNVTSVSDATMRAIPAILSGQYPEKGLLPVVQDYPGNLLKLLEASYDIEVLEPVTQLYRSQGSANRTDSNHLKRVRALLADVGVLYLHVISPPVWQGLLPPIANQWGDFGKGSALQASADFDDFLRGIEADSSPNDLYFIHTLLPHPPHVYFPSGTMYTRIAAEPSGEGSQWGAWGENEWAVLQSYKRHLLQVGFVDSLLGRLLDRLRETGLFDRALIVVTADHGLSFRPGDSRRGISETNFVDIMSVPLLIKKPYQRSGAIDESEVESVDIFPTVTEILSVETTWPVAGRSVFDQSAPVRTEKVFYGRDRMRFDVNRFSGMNDALARKLEMFGSGSSLHKLFEIGPFGEELVGKSLSEVEIAGQGDAHIRLLNENLFKDVDPNSGFVPAEITGLVMSRVPSEDPLALAVAVNGIIGGTTWSYPSESRSAVWSVLVDESAFQAGDNEIEVFPISVAGDWPALLLPRQLGEGSSYLDMRLGASRVPGVAESGFERPARWAGGTLVRWTNGSAMLKVPADLKDPPGAVRVDLAWIGPVETTFRLVVNGQEVFTRSFPGEQYPAPKKSLVIPLRGVTQRKRMVIELLSDTFVPADTIKGSNDDRNLGVAVEGVWLLRDTTDADGL